MSLPVTPNTSSTNLTQFVDKRKYVLKLLPLLNLKNFAFVFFTKSIAYSFSFFPSLILGSHL